MLILPTNHKNQTCYKTLTIFSSDNGTTTSALLVCLVSTKPRSRFRRARALLSRIPKLFLWSSSLRSIPKGSSDPLSVRCPGCLTYRVRFYSYVQIIPFASLYSLCGVRVALSSALVSEPSGCEFESRFESRFVFVHRPLTVGRGRLAHRQRETILPDHFSGWWGVPPPPSQEDLLSSFSCYSLAQLLTTQLCVVSQYLCVWRKLLSQVPRCAVCETDCCNTLANTVRVFRTFCPWIFRFFRILEFWTVIILMKGIPSRKLDHNISTGLWASRATCGWI